MVSDFCLLALLSTISQFYTILKLGIKWEKTVPVTAKRRVGKHMGGRCPMNSCKTRSSASNYWISRFLQWKKTTQYFHLTRQLNFSSMALQLSSTKRLSQLYFHFPPTLKGFPPPCPNSSSIMKFHVDFKPRFFTSAVSRASQATHPYQTSSHRKDMNEWARQTFRASSNWCCSNTAAAGAVYDLQC